jgi:predicted Zn-dependent protease
MKTFSISLFLVLLCLFVLNPSAAQAQQGKAGQDISGALSQMDTMLNQEKREYTPEEEYYLGRAVGANILSFYKPYTRNRELTDYLNRICSAITVNSPQPELYNGYHVMILDSQEINAFATPGGHIFLSRGLVEAVNSEDALAAVIAHETAHILLKHGITMIKDMALTQDLSRTGTAAAGTAAREAGMDAELLSFGNSVNAVVNAMVKNGYSRQQEYAADDAALILMAAAGYDPAALIEMLQLLEGAQKAHPGGFNTTHPSPGERIRNAAAKAQSYRIRNTRSYRQNRFKNK